MQKEVLVKAVNAARATGNDFALLVDGGREISGNSETGRIYMNDTIEGVAGLESNRLNISIEESDVNVIIASYDDIKDFKMAGSVADIEAFLTAFGTPITDEDKALYSKLAKSRHTIIPQTGNYVKDPDDNTKYEDINKNAGMNGPHVTVG